jgi:glycerol kinase
MRSRGLLLAIDQGTTNTKAVLVGKDGRSVFVASASVGVTHPRSDWVEQDPIALWESVEQAVAECVKAAGDQGIAAVGIANQRETVVAWDRATGVPVAPAIIWQCRRSAEICARLEKSGAGEMIRARTGLGIDPLFSASKMGWLLENVSGLRERTEAGEVCFGTVDSWLIWELTGGRVHACDASNASRTQLFNLESGIWDSELLRLFDVPLVALPEVRDSSGSFGECVGIAGLDGVPILSAMGDSHAALAAHGAHAPGTVKATYGTGSSVMTLLPKFSVAEHGASTTIAWRVKGQTQFALEGNVSMTGSAVRWVGEFLELAKPTEDAVRLAATVEDSGGVYFVPAMVGLGAPHWDTEVRGALMGLGRNSKSGHMARAAIEAIAFQIRDVLEAMEMVAGHELSTLRADGGATKNDELMQFQADVLGRVVVRSETEELSALGAAWMAGLELGWWDSLQEFEALVREPVRFVPKMVTDERERRYNGWKNAVAKARYRPCPTERVR